MADKVRCKVYMSSISNNFCGKNADGTNCIMYRIGFNFVSGDKCPENKLFWQYSPDGKLEFATINKDAVEMLEMGKEYYLDLIPA